MRPIRHPRARPPAAPARPAGIGRVDVPVGRCAARRVTARAATRFSGTVRAGGSAALAAVAQLRIAAPAP